MAPDLDRRHAWDPVTRLGIAAEALAGLAARLRADVDGIELSPDVAAGLDAVVDRLGVDVVAMTSEERRRVEMSARALLLQAEDLLADPGRPPGWAFDDPAVLLSTGRLSANIAGVIAQIAPALDGLQDALQRPGARFLDVGAGVAALSIALCETWPGLHVVGLEPWAPAFALAEAQVASSDVTDRIELRSACIEDLDDGAAFDVAWLAGPFVPPAVIPAALERLHNTLKPGGWLLFGRFAGPQEPLADAVTRLRVLRSGGSVADAEQLGALMCVRRDWQTSTRSSAHGRPPSASSSVGGRVDATEDSDDRKASRLARRRIDAPAAATSGLPRPATRAPRPRRTPSGRASIEKGTAPDGYLCAHALNLAGTRAPPPARRERCS